MKITKWEFGLIWSLILYLILKLSDMSIFNTDRLNLIFIIPIFISLIYIHWVYPISLILRKEEK